MAQDQRKRQKALAKKKQREIQVRKEANKLRNPTPSELVRSMQNGAWYACYEMGVEGLHNLMCIRQTQQGPIACTFLVDLFCLGVKDAGIRRSIDLAMISDLVLERDGRRVSPAYVLKLLNFASRESQKIGFAPHRLTSTLLPIFHDVDEGDCPETFEFGRNGKPFYMSGPNEDSFQIQEIVATLSKLGPGNFDVMVGGNNGMQAMLESHSITTDADGDAKPS
ncbi:hypothetical protein SH449x_000903 [Pirellulaceae bacterium SH449]